MVQPYYAPPPPKKTSVLLIVLLVLGGLVVAAIVISALAVPTFLRYMKRAKISEAPENVDRLGRAAHRWLAGESAPLATSDWTPPGSACEAGGKFRSDPSLWNVPPWSDLMFSVDRPSAFQYRVGSSPEQIVVEAQGDVDCDGKLSHYQMWVTRNAMGPLETENEGE